MNIDTNQVTPDPEEKKRCTICLVVRYFALTLFVLTIAFYFYVKYERGLVAEKVQQVNEATAQADQQ